MISGRTIVRTVGKPRPLVVDPQIATRLLVFALAGNTGTIAVGDANVSEVSGNESGMPLAAKDYLDLSGRIDLSEVWIDSDTVDEGVRWLAMV